METCKRLGEKRAAPCKIHRRLSQQHSNSACNTSAMVSKRTQIHSIQMHPCVLLLCHSSEPFELGGYHFICLHQQIGATVHDRSCHCFTYRLVRICNSTGYSIPAGGAASACRVHQPRAKAGSEGVLQVPVYTIPSQLPEARQAQLYTTQAALANLPSKPMADAAGMRLPSSFSKSGLDRLRALQSSA